MVDASLYPNRQIGEVILPPSDVVDQVRVAVNLSESPLGWLASRGMVTHSQVEAGERLRRDHYRAGMGARITMRWDPAPGSGGGGSGGATAQSLAAIDARRRFDSAIEAVGPGLSDVLWRVVCEGEGLSEAEKGLGWPARAGKLVLGMALDRLVEHYKYRNGYKSIDNRHDLV